MRKMTSRDDTTMQFFNGNKTAFFELLICISGTWNQKTTALAISCKMCFMINGTSAKTLDHNYVF